MNLPWIRSRPFLANGGLLALETQDRRLCSALPLSKVLRLNRVEIAWTAVNCIFLVVPIGAIVLHLYGARISATVTVGLRAALVSKLLSVFDQAIYTVLSCIVVSTLALLRGFYRKHMLRFLFWPAVATLVCTILLDNKVGTVGADSLAEILSTNWREATAYALQALSTMNISGKQLVVALSPAALYGLFALLARFSGLQPKLFPAILSLAVSAGALAVLFSLDTLRLVSAYRDTHVIQQRLAAATSAELGKFTQQRSGPRLIVYIGESTNRELYRALAGQIEKRPFKDNVVMFDQVISPHSHTTPSLLRELTVSDDPFGDQLKYDTELWRANLISVLKDMGVRTEWYSNQAQDEWTAKLFAQQAGKEYFQNQAWGSAFTGYHKPDSELLPQLRHAIQLSEAGAIFFHSYAGHIPYCDNLPAKAPTPSPDIRTKLPFKAVFGDLPILNRGRHLREINCYDRALAYIAANLDSVMQEMWTAAEPMVLVYFADHGEDVLDGTGHDSAIASYRKIEIPLVVFFNAAARRQYPWEFDAVSANQEARYSLAWISDSLVDITGLGYKRNLLSIFRRLDQIPDRYSSLRLYHGQRFIIAVDSDRDTQGVAFLTDIDLYEKRRLIQSFPAGLQKRICAHRADSWMKFNEASKIFPCLEVDLVLDSDAEQVYVFHPPKAKSYLTLKDLMSHQSNNWSKLWLDAKNLDQSNAVFFLQYLNQLFAPAQRSGILVETSLDTSSNTEVRSLLTNFRNSGYSLSYYLPTDEGIRCSQSPAAPGCAEFADRIVATISSLPYSSLSFDIRAETLAKAIQRRRNIQLNTWDLDVKQASGIDRELLGDVGMYLIPYHSRFDY